ncbi:TfuA-like protein [Streptomyces sp. NPDC002838]|uniref:TfuA-like protein n=1 Tax=Streptomyces sp. NPDC002838 TaxID=3154436 RepID=UPI0033263EE7
MTTHVFIGPTLPAEQVLAAAPGAVVHGPVRHGDLLALDAATEDIVVIIDGVFHQTAPVRHKEIIDVLAGGTRVIGASSMGALRAAELWPYGMEGVGLVFGMYAQGTLEADDEVVVGRLPSGDHRQMAVPLVNVRWTISNAVAQSVLVEKRGADLLEAARSLDYTERSWGAIEHAARRLSPALAESAVALRRFADRHPEASDLKRRDALLALSHSAAPRKPAGSSASAAAWMVPRTMYLERWRGTFRPAVRDKRSTSVCELDVLRFQQLYAPDFPTRYRRFALTRIAGHLTVFEDRGLIHAALKAAAECGITEDRLPRAAWAYWLTPEELSDSSSERRLLKLLVRSFRTAPGATPFYDAPTELRGTDHAWTSSADAVAAADRLNRQVARTDASRTPRNLPDAVVRQHLVDIWHVRRPTELEAAARDRGFVSLAEAEDAARRFVLLHRARQRSGTGAV